MVSRRHTCSFPTPAENLRDRPRLASTLHPLDFGVKGFALRRCQILVGLRLRLRRLGTTKVQIGIQSLDDAVLAANQRGHDVAATRVAVARLRLAGFKIHVHWMPNLLGSTPEKDAEDFDRLFGDPAIRPDELKIYPCSLIESAELMQYHERGEWRPYDHDELLEIRYQWRSSHLPLVEARVRWQEELERLTGAVRKGEQFDVYLRLTWQFKIKDF